jgi:hypothetical protein
VYEEVDAEIDDDVYEEADAGWDWIICGDDVSGEFEISSSSSEISITSLLSSTEVSIGAGIVVEEWFVEEDDDVDEEADAGWHVRICGVDVSVEVDWNIWDECEVIKSAKQDDERWLWGGSGTVGS